MNIDSMQYSVLMPLWHKEELSYLQQSLQSMVQQNKPPQEFVFVLDQPISKKMKSFIQSLLPASINIQFVKAYHLHGQGLGALLREGVTKCSCPYIARMDSDDISLPSRCEKELQLFAMFPDLAVVGSCLTEFSHTPKDLHSVRKVPQQGMSIRHFAKYRNPMNHSTVMLKKDDLLSVGNYDANFSYCEDYELWYRMIKKGYILYNIQESLLYYRTGSDFLNRRSRKGNRHAYLKLRKIMLKDHFINYFEFLLFTFIQYFFSVSPNYMKKFIYYNLRK